MKVTLLVGVRGVQGRVVGTGSLGTRRDCLPMMERHPLRNCYRYIGK